MTTFTTFTGPSTATGPDHLENDVGKRGNGEGSIYQLKNGLWRADLTLGFDPDTGRQRRKTRTAKTRKDAARILDEMKVMYTGLTPDSGSETLTDYLEAWLRTKATMVRPRTIESYESTLRRHVVPTLGKLPLVEVETYAIQRVLDHVAERSGNRTSNYVRTVLNSAMQQALKWRRITRNPVFGTTKKRENPRERTIWTPDEVRQFLSAAEEHRLFALFYTALTTGLRKGELLGLKWEDIQDGAVHVVRTVSTRSGRVVESEPKSRSSRRVVTIDPKTVEILSRHREAQGRELAVLDIKVVPTRVFTNELGETLDGSNVSKVWHRLQKEAGVPRARLHDARHMHMSMLIGHGVDVRTIADRAGHADPVLTLRQYSHALEARRRQAAIPLGVLLGCDDSEDSV